MNNDENNVYLIMTGLLVQNRRTAYREIMVLVLRGDLHHAGVCFNECPVVPQTQSLTNTLFQSDLII